MEHTGKLIKLGNTADHSVVLWCMFVSQQLQVDGLRSSLHAPVLCKGNEDQLFVCVFEPRQRPLRSVLPHPLLIRIVGQLEPSHVCDVLPQRQTAVHPLVINSEVIVELDDTFGFLLEFPVGLLRPPLFEVAVAVVLAPPVIISMC